MEIKMAKYAVGDEVEVKQSQRLADMTLMETWRAAVVTNVDDLMGVGVEFSNGDAATLVDDSSIRKVAKAKKIEPTKVEEPKVVAPPKPVAKPAAKPAADKSKK